MSSAGDFVIENGILKKYVGPGGGVVIPEGVTEIGNFAFQYCEKLISVSIPNGTWRIGRNAFNDCKNMKTVMIPDSIIDIGPFAFMGCTELNRIQLPSGLESIGEFAFSSCDQLTEIQIPASVTQLTGNSLNGCRVNVAEGNQYFCSVDGILFDKNMTKLIRVPRTRSGDCAIPESVTEIGDDAFYMCAGVTAVTIPSGVTMIGRNAFFGCRGLREISLPDYLVSMGEGAFEYCEGLTELRIPHGIKRIEKETFEGCIGLLTVVIPDSIVSIGNAAFAGCKNLKEVSIPGSVQSIEEGSFRFCSKLTRLAIPDGVTSIEKEILFRCDDLKTVMIPDGTTSIHENLFGYRAVETGILISDPKRLPLALRRNAAIGFAEAGNGKDDARWEANSKYIKSNAVKLIDTAMQHPALLSLMCKEKLIAPKDAEKFLESARKTGNAELISTMMDYQANKISTKEKEKLAAQKQTQQDQVMDRMIARQGMTGIAGLNIAVTGGLETFKNRNELKTFIAENGAKMASSLTVKVDYLIMNDPASDSEKAQKAQELEIDIISERRFNEIVGRTFTIEDGILLQYNGSIGDVTIPENVVGIGRSVFEGMAALTRVTVPASVKKIGAYAFEDCPNLTICAPAKSFAAKYAQKHNIPFVAE